MQHCAVRLAQEFNEACDPTRYGESCNVYVRDAALGEFDYDRDLYDEYGRRFRVNDGQPFLLEREIRGSFEKFNSNSGWSSGTDPILEAFSHWTWVHTDGDHLVCDLQGHRGEPGDGTPYRGEEDYYYLLTDPAICSSCREFGESDLGPPASTRSSRTTGATSGASISTSSTSGPSTRSPRWRGVAPRATTA